MCLASCSLDLSHQVSMLVQRYEQLQNMVSNLARPPAPASAFAAEPGDAPASSWVAAWGVSGEGCWVTFA